MTEKTLYRKYRPQSFDEFVGQSSIVKILRRAIELEQISHAYLFAGPRGTGKTTLARLLAKTLNCQNLKKGDSSPCLECSNCLAFSRGNFPDLVELDAASHRGIDEIREIRDQVRFLPSVGRYKVYVIDEAHQLTREASNALLKTLEEPPSHVIFVLATTEPHKILDTIRSRCQIFHFETLSLQEILQKLQKIIEQEGYKADKEALEIIAKRARGSLRDAETLLQQVLILSDTKELGSEQVAEILGEISEKEVLELFGLLLSHNTPQALKLVQSLVEQGKDIREVMVHLAQIVRNAIVLKISEDATLLSQNYSTEELERLNSLVATVELRDLKKILDYTLVAISQFRYSPIPSLPLEIAIVQICENF